jgi:hypothetical protein
MSIEAMKQALEALEELVNLIEGIRVGEYEPDSFTTQPAQTTITALRAALYPAKNTNKPLIKEDVDFLVEKYSALKSRWIGDEVFVYTECNGAVLVRAVERAHGIGVLND